MANSPEDWTDAELKAAATVMAQDIAHGVPADEAKRKALEQAYKDESELHRLADDENSGKARALLAELKKETMQRAKMMLSISLEMGWQPDAQSLAAQRADNTHDRNVQANDFYDLLKSIAASADNELAYKANDVKVMIQKATNYQVIKNQLPAVLGDIRSGNLKDAYLNRKRETVQAGTTGLLLRAMEVLDSRKMMIEVDERGKAINSNDADTLREIAAMKKQIKDIVPELKEAIGNRTDWKSGTATGWKPAGPQASMAAVGSLERILKDERHQEWGKYNSKAAQTQAGRVETRLGRIKDAAVARGLPEDTRSAVAETQKWIERQKAEKAAKGQEPSK